MKRLSPIRKCFSTRSVPLCLPLERTSFSSSSTTLFTILFSHSPSLRPHTVTCRALQHSLVTARRRSFPPLNLHRARVRRKSRAASFKSLYRKRANTPCSCRRSPSRFRYISNDAGRVKSFLLRIFYRSRTPQPFTHSALLSGG
jgi:hypothetical protein